MFNAVFLEKVNSGMGNRNGEWQESSVVMVWLLSSFIY